ncbi:MAG: type II toxin-antitoxin system PemK/MazF family toxin [Pseudobdellovibrionaceae bacterium]
MNIERGQILLVDLDPTKGSEIRKTRPAVVVTNNIANFYSRLLVVVPLTSQNLDEVYPHEVLIERSNGILKSSKANVAQIRAVDRSRIRSKLGKVSDKNLKEIDIALKLHLGLL